MADKRDSPRKVSSYLRKVRKPQLERQRRERINASIDRLKLLIADTIRQQKAPMTRVDKADILELTVFHLTQLQQHQRAARVAYEATAASFNADFRDCARETVNLLTDNNATDTSLTTSESDNLHGVYMEKTKLVEESRLTKTKVQSSSTHVHPAQDQHTFMSTPRRVDDRIDSHKSPMDTPEFSPISRLLEGQCDVSIHFSSASGPSFNSDESGFSSLNVSSGAQSRDSLASEGEVSIGENTEDKIGHVIKDNLWRPW
ncbi:enhancer of split mgamma protein-like [Mya arenaria]|uniref:enhancer of split mgamma protein-like n=1 Tax=Mya arenaria TaxID=6604 RepID=UPI0022E5E7EA|nr:enhancer of split mgamma protein-like [Mya arenaria]